MLERCHGLNCARRCTFPGHGLPGRGAPPRHLPLARYNAGCPGLQRHRRERVEWGWKEVMALLSALTPAWMIRLLVSVSLVTKAAWALVSEHIRASLARDMPSSCTTTSSRPQRWRRAAAESTL